MMTEDAYRQILSQSKHNFKRINNPPVVIYNPRKKTVSVKYDFALGLIKKIKIIASCQAWLRLRDPEGTDAMPFERIEPLIYRPAREKLSSLRQYAINYPESFLADFRDCIKWSHTKNPLAKADSQI
jgi:hypothetical protein